MKCCDCGKECRVPAGATGMRCANCSMRTCPACDGEGAMVVFGIRYAPGHSGPPVRKLRCHVCEGRGEVSGEQVLRMERGKSFRNYRVSILSFGLREASNKWGMRAVELSRIEQGKTETDWTPPGWCDSSTEGGD